MPVSCPIVFPRLTDEEFGALDYGIMRHAFDSHRELGRLADETIYQADFVARLTAAGYTAQREVPITVSFRSFMKIFFMDVVVNGKALYEFKAVSALTAEHEAQVMNYLLMVDSGHGKIISLRPTSVESRFANAPITLADRRSFVVDDRRWLDDGSARDMVVELLSDWGTGLALSLYYQAMIHLLGGESLVTRQLPMCRGEVPLGNQRFHLLGDDTAFRITAFNGLIAGYESQISRLLKLSPLKALHWINIGLREVTFITVT